MGFETVLYVAKEGVATITANRPEVRNALNLTMRREIWQALEQAEADPEVKGVVLTGQGEKAFIAGADINELRDRDTIAALTPAYRLDTKIEGLSKPVIAAVNGYALGGGCEVAMACLVRVASETARFGQPEINLGIIPGMGGTQRLPRLVGFGRAMQLVLTGEIIEAQEAYRIGLVNSVVAPGELLLFAHELARKIGSKPPVAWRAARDAMLRGFDMSLRDALELENKLFAICCGTEDKREGMTAFLEKRPPHFKGR